MARSALRVAGPSIDATLHSAELKDDRFQSVRPSFGRRASRALARFLIPAFIGVAGTLALESYGEAAKQIIASWAPQLGWPVSLLSQLRPVAARNQLAIGFRDRRRTIEHTCRSGVYAGCTASRTRCTGGSGHHRGRRRTRGPFA